MPLPLSPHQQAEHEASLTQPAAQAHPEEVIAFAPIPYHLYVLIFHRAIDLLG